jgi:hypothetical protein
MVRQQVFVDQRLAHDGAQHFQQRGGGQPQDGPAQMVLVGRAARRSRAIACRIWPAVD